jgi:hypothetical protein
LGISTLENFVNKCKKITSRIEMDEGYFDIGVKRMRESTIEGEK